MEAIYAGAVPVLLSDHYRLPFEDRVSWRDFVLRRSESELSTVPEQLQRMRNGPLLALKHSLREAQQRLTPDRQLGWMIDELRRRRTGRARYRQVS